ncbi:MAG: hypothetical protein Q7S01_06475 [bacterium]|nr:hypothetical protein [bacterium]
MAYAVLEKTLDYFLHPKNSWLYGHDVQRAMTAFSGSPDPLPVHGLDFFIDWFAFDFQFRPDKNLLRYAGESNPMQFGDDELAALREIAENNRYDFFEAISFGKKIPTELKSVRDGNSYVLSTENRIRKVRVGEVVVCRIGRVGDAWHLMMDQGVGMYRPGARDRRHMRKDFPVFNSQVVWREIVSANAVLLDAEAMPDGEMLVSGFAPGNSHQEDDDCPICRAMRKAKAEKRKLTHQELTDAFAEANKEKDKKSKN